MEVFSEAFAPFVVHVPFPYHSTMLDPIIDIRVDLWYGRRLQLNDPDRMGKCVCTQLIARMQQTLLRSVMRGSETEFSIKLVHLRRGIADLALRVPRVRQF